MAHAEPTVLRLLKGDTTKGKNPINKNDPSLFMQAEIPQRPGNLRDKEARNEWDRVTKLLDGARILTSVDQKILLIYCNTWSVYREAEKNIVKNGFYETLDNGYPAQNPAVSVMHTARKDLIRLLVELGMTPAARTRIHVLPEAERKMGLAAFDDE